MEPDSRLQRQKSMSIQPQGPSGSRRLAPLVAAAVVVVVIGALIGGVYVLRSPSGPTGPTTPPVLHLSEVAGAALGSPTASAAGAAVRSSAGTTSLKGSGFSLVGTLPKGPATAAIRRVTAEPVTTTMVSALERALAMTGRPVHVAGGWYLVAGTSELSVSELAGGKWVYTDQRCITAAAVGPQFGADCSQAAPPPPVATAPDTHSVPRGNGNVNPPGTPVPTPAPLADSIARAIAAPVFAAVGVNVAAVQVQTGGGQASLISSPTVAGLSVVGLDSLVSIGTNRKIVNASGWLAASTPGPMYPLNSARAAYDTLISEPAPMMAPDLACRVAAGTQGCLAAPERVVTGGTLGLTQAYSSGGAMLLVPAWLFHLRGQKDPIAVVAVASAYLGQPAPPPESGRATTGSSAGSAGGTGAMTTSTGSPPQGHPGGPATAPPARPMP
jgi:hypothetical protein